MQYSVTAAAAGAKVRRSLISATFVPRGTDALVEAFKNSNIYANMIAEMDAYDHTMHGFRGHHLAKIEKLRLVHEKDGEVGISGDDIDEEGESKLSESESKVLMNERIALGLPLENLQADDIDNEWPAYYRERFTGSWWFHFQLTLMRQVKVNSMLFFQHVFLYRKLNLLFLFVI